MFRFSQVLVSEGDYVIEWVEVSVLGYQRRVEKGRECIWVG